MKIYKLGNLVDAKAYFLQNRIIIFTSKELIRLVRCMDFKFMVYRMDPEFAAIRGHNSAHSFATGPDTADPFISPLLLTITPALSSK